jgi:hypothetical protein
MQRDGVAHVGHRRSARMGEGAHASAAQPPPNSPIRSVRGLGTGLAKALEAGVAIASRTAAWACQPHDLYRRSFGVRGSYPDLIAEGGPQTP